MNRSERQGGAHLKTAGNGPDAVLRYGGGGPGCFEKTEGGEKKTMNISTLAVIGSQWGDEGKGKITDFLAEDMDLVVRYQGGPNAGHTVVVGSETFKLHHLPSGILYPGKKCILGDGMVLDPLILQAELQELQGRGVEAGDLFISTRAHLIMPYHIKLDELEEGKRAGRQIGTTRRGIGPAYADKYARQGLRGGDLLADEKDLADKLGQILAAKNEVLLKMYGAAAYSMADLEEEYLPAARLMKPYLTETSLMINREIGQGARVLFEGAQGSMLDIDHGTYPYVTSSNPTAGGICLGAGVAPRLIGPILGVTKAYTTRVGSGPFPTELQDAIGDHIRQVGREYGTTTGRPRRIGWLDGVALRHAARLNGFQFLALTLFDVLSGLETIKIATAYRAEAELLHYFPPSLALLEQCSPVYREFDGWEGDITNLRKFEDLPHQARRYIQGLEEITGVPVGLVSVGPRRDQTIVLSEELK